MKQRIFLSPPHMSGNEQRYVDDAFLSNWIAPFGPHIDAFEREMAALVGRAHAAALFSGTTALHLAMILSDVQPEDEGICSWATLSTSSNAVAYCRTRPVFFNSEPLSWNLYPEILREELERGMRLGQIPKAVIDFHI